LALLPGEYLTDLGRSGLQLIQRRDGTAFGLDAVLLSHFVRLPRHGRVIDLGTGTGVIALLLAATAPEASIDALELDPGLAAMAARSVALNSLEERVTVRQGDLREVASHYPSGQCDAVVINPPYFPVGGGRLSPSPVRAGSRSELTCTLSDVCQAAAHLLKGRGRLYLVHRPERLADILGACRERGLEPKRFRLVQPTPNTAPNLLLLAAQRGARPGLTVEPTLVVRSAGAYTAELSAIYGEPTRPASAPAEAISDPEKEQ
jgi:tRNA1Val (adenine37-N6)-methyltransferase